MSITLATKVYTFSGFIAGRISKYLNRESDQPSGFRNLTVVVDEPGNTESYKVRWKLKLPTVVDEQACACPDGMVRESFVDIVATIHKGSSLAERTLLATSIEDLASSDEFTSSITSLEQPAV